MLRQSRVHFRRRRKKKPPRIKKAKSYIYAYSSIFPSQSRVWREEARLPGAMSNYARGRSREYQAIKKLRAEGWLCSRSAMSHGPVDVFAAKDGNTLVIQVKSGTSRMRKGEIDTLKRWAEAFDADGEIWYYKKRGKLQRQVIRTRSAVKGNGQTTSTSALPPRIPP
jgi:Holliday junction resolvase